MSLDLDPGYQFDALWDTPQRVVSRIPPTDDVTVKALGAKDPTTGEFSLLGEVTLTVRGFSGEDHEALRRPLDQAWEAWRVVHAAIESQKAEINPMGQADAIGEKVASELVHGRLGKWAERANREVVTASRVICFLGVVGWQAGQLRHKGQDVPYSTEDRIILGKTRQGLSTLPLGLLESAGCTLTLAREILRVSDGRPAPKEATKEADPLALAEAGKTLTEAA